jgi:threonine dehydrogenase-like Zn-dependent dehydrogenase
MSEPTDIEKKSLEAHVELCAERYRLLENKLETLDEKLESVVAAIDTVKCSIVAMAEKRNSQLIGWGIGIIGSLTAAVVWLLTNYVFK